MIFLAACSSDSEAVASPPGAGGGATGPTPGAGDMVAAGPTLPACAGAGPAVSIPPQVPATLRLPPGTVITSADVRPDGSVALVGYSPVTLRQAVRFFNTDFVEAGLFVGAGDLEGDEAEAPYSGNGIRGRWKVNGILGCQTAVILQISAEPGS